MNSGSGSAFRSNAVLYTAAVLVTRTASLVMLPVNTRFLSPADYGVLQLLAMFTDITAILLTAGMNSGVQRFYFKAKTDEARRAVVSTAFFLEVGLAGLGTVLMLVAAPFVAAGVLGNVEYTTLVRIVALDFTLGALSAVPLMLLQTEQRAKAFVALTLARLGLQLSLNVLFLVGLGWGVQGVLTSTLISNGVFGALLVGWLLRRTGVRIDRHVLSELRRFGIPHQIAFAGAFINTFGDRFFLRASVGLSAVGLYGMAYQFGFLLAQVASAPFLQAWNPQRYALLEQPREARDAATAQSFYYFNCVLLSCAVLIGLFIEPALAVLTAAAFHDAAKIVPVILAAYVVQSWTDVVKFGIDAAEQTRYHAYAMWCSVVATVVLYAALIPPFGVYGAAVATLAGFFVRFWLSNLWGQRLMPVAYGWNRILLIFLLGTSVISAYYAIAPRGLSLQVVIALACWGTFLTVLLVFISRRPERQLFLRLVSAPGRALATLASGVTARD